MKIDRILTELIIFARERECEDDGLLRAAERHLEAVRRVKAWRARRSRKGECERCEGPSNSGILCWNCLALAPAPIRHAFRDAVGIEAMRSATERIRTWIKTSTATGERRAA